jgi:hypothetical protein
VSYVPFRDNPDLEDLPAGTYLRLVPLAEQIERSSAIGNHGDQCGCTDPACTVLRKYLHGWAPTTVAEALGWLVAKGLLDLDAARAAGWPT